MKKLLIIFVVLVSLFSTKMAMAIQYAFTPRLSATTTYTDNVDLVSDERNPEDDLITNLSAGFSAQMFGKNHGLELSYDPSYAFYREEDDNDGWRHNARLRAWSQVTAYTSLNFRDSFFLTEDPVPSQETEVLPEEEPLLPVDTTVRRNRQQYYRNSASINLNHQFDQKNSVSIGYTYSLLRNDDVTLEDSDSHNSSASLNLGLTSHFGIELSGSYTRGTFEREIGFTGSASDDFDNWNSSLSLIWQVSKKLSTNIQFAYTDRDFDEQEEDYKIYDTSAGLDYTFAEGEFLSFSVGYFRQDREVSDDETGIIIDGNLGKTWRIKRGSINLTASSGYNQSDFGAESLGFEVFYQGRVAASYDFTKRLSGDINGLYRRSEFRDQVPEREDDIIRGGLGFNWQPLTWISLRLEYSYAQVNSNEDVNDYEENRGSFSVSLSPDRPYKKTY